jgi:hypothetical protein
MAMPQPTCTPRPEDKQKCPTCKRKMVQLFLTQACDHCDYGIPKDRLHRGFIVAQGVVDPAEERHEEYVFRTRMDAERWRTAAGRDGQDIREVFSIEAFRWHLSRGTLRDVVLADHMFEIFPDHRYEPLPHRAFLAPE